MNVTVNKPIPDKFADEVQKLFANEACLFAVVGDLNLKGRYAESVAVFTADRLVAFDECCENSSETVLYSDIEKAEVKRFYGNAVFKVKLKNGKKKMLLRFSYASAEVADAAAVFINAVNDGCELEQELETVKSVYHKQRCFCPKCGRKLPNPEAECINCAGKGKLVSKFGKYVIPEKFSLLGCMVFSVAVTALSLVPP